MLPPSEGDGSRDKTVAIIVGCVVGGIVVVFLGAVGLFIGIRYRLRILAYLGGSTEYETLG